MEDRNFKCFRIPERGATATDKSMALLDEMVEWLHQPFHTQFFEGDDISFVFWEGDEKIEVLQGDWLTSIPTGSGEERRFVRLPRKARKMRMVQNTDDTESELWVWELPNGQAVYLFDGREPRLTTLSVDKPSNRGTWVPGQEDFK